MKRLERKRRSIWIDIAFSVSIIVLTAVAIYIVFALKDGKETASEVKSLKDKIVVDSIDSNYPGIKIISETSNDTKTPYFIQYPKSSNKEFNERITSYIQHVRNHYLEQMENVKNDEQAKGELNSTFETFHHNSGHYSFVLVTNMFIDGKKELSEIRTFHLHTETGEQLQVQNVFADDENVLNELVNRIQKTFQSAEYEQTLRVEQLPKFIQADWSNFANFALSEDAIIFYFEESTFLDEKAGVPIAALPFEDINNLLREPFQVEKVASENTNVPTGEADPESVAPSDNPSSTPEAGENSGENPPVTEDEETDVKKVALTFDDGPDPKSTVQILEILKKYDAKATFFMLGSRVEYYPEIAKLVQEAGHELGNHTWNHPDLTKLGAERIREEINRTSAIIEQVTGAQATVFRPPYGAINSAVRAQTKVPVILWDVDTLDWKHRDSSKLLNYVKEGTKDGSVILMHDIHQSTADGLEAVMQFLQSEGYTFVTVTELGYE